MLAKLLPAILDKLDISMMKMSSLSRMAGKSLASMTVPKMMWAMLFHFNL